jgi:hypothetical protein
LYSIYFLFFGYSPVNRILMLYIVSLFEQSVEVRDLRLKSPTKSYHLGLGLIRITGAPAASWQLIIFSTLLNSLLLSVAKILHTRYHCRRIARLATSGGIVASMWLNVVGYVRIESWVRINRVCHWMCVCSWLSCFPALSPIYIFILGSDWSITAITIARPIM